MTCPGPDRLIAVGKHRDLEHAARDPGAPPGPANPTAPPPPPWPNASKPPKAFTAYRQRGHIAETPHGNIKHNLGFRQFSLRGTPKVTAEWNLITSVHNLLTAISAGQLHHPGTHRPLNQPGHTRPLAQPPTAPKQTQTQARHRPAPPPNPRQQPVQRQQRVDVALQNGSQQQLRDDVAVSTTPLSIISPAAATI